MRCAHQTPNNLSISVAAHPVTHKYAWRHGQPVPGGRADAALRAKKASSTQRHQGLCLVWHKPPEVIPGRPGLLCLLQPKFLLQSPPST